MAANTATVLSSFRKELLNASHAFGVPSTGSGRTAARDTFCIALFRNSSGIGPANTSYTQISASEVTSSGYTAGGNSCATTDPATTGGTGIVAFWTPASVAAWTNVTMTGSNATDLALLYNSTCTAKLGVATFALGVIDTGQAPSAGTFTLTMPTNDLSTGLIRIS